MFQGKIRSIRYKKSVDSFWTTSPTASAFACTPRWAALDIIIHMNTIPPDCLESAYGRIETDRPCYRPLDTVKVHIEGPGFALSEPCRVWACDSDQKPYADFQVELRGGSADLEFVTGGKLGVHYLYLCLPGELRNQGRWSRYVNFELDCETSLHTGDPDFDPLYPLTRSLVRLGRRAYDTPQGRMVGYISGDTWHFDGLWLRDWIYQLPAYQYWEREMTCGLERFLERQQPDGMIHDGIERSGRTWRVGLESDVEYILVQGVYETWQATGDDAWLRAALPKLEKALAFIQSAPKHWDETHRLVKRQHSCDTWDYDIDGTSDQGGQRQVIATCDQSGYARAFGLMSRLYAHLGDDSAARRWAGQAAAYRQRAVDLLWDGVKFQHHVHLDQIDHGDFDERSQLAMGNTWAVTRGLADGEQARSIVDEYRRRWAETGDAYPWWSLQPGYPDHLNYWKDSFRRQGGYANGGLMPWVGGELARGALLNGREAWGVELLRQWASHLRQHGGAHVWYWPGGQAGFRTTNEVNSTGWGMCEWINALFQGLAGIRDEDCLYRRVTLSPRWAAAGVNEAEAQVRYAASQGYFAYRYHRRGQTLRLAYSGSGSEVGFHVLLPEGASVMRVAINGEGVDFRVVQVDRSHYVDFTGPIEPVCAAQIDLG